jgi:CRISPR-associated endonuclease Csn1
LDGIFDELGTKRDDDHRRHAVDAVIVGLTENEHLRKLAASKYSIKGIHFEQPWENFRDQLKEKVKNINVSFKVQRKVSGALHEETSYGFTGKQDENGQNIYVYRKSLDALTMPMVEKIVDTEVRKIVKNRLIEKGINIENGDRKIPKEVWSLPLYMKTTKSDKKVPIKKVRIHDVFNKMIPIKDKSGKLYRYVSPGSNHHIEIYEYKDEKGRIKKDGIIVTTFEAVQRSHRGEPVVQKEHGTGKKFICSLAANETFMVTTENERKILHRIEKITESNGNISIILRPYTYSGKCRDSDKPPLILRKSPNTLKGYKVTVDPLGRIWPTKD